MAQISWAGLYTLNAELYPTYIRGTGVGWGNAIAKIGGVVAPAVTGAMIDMPGGEIIVLILLSGMFLGASIVCLFFRETRVKTVESSSK